MSGRRQVRKKIAFIRNPVSRNVKLNTPIQSLVTGGTFDKEYNEQHGWLFFRKTHLPEMLELGRCRQKAPTRKLMMIGSLEMKE